MYTFNGKYGWNNELTFVLLSVFTVVFLKYWWSRRSKTAYTKKTTTTTNFLTTIYDFFRTASNPKKFLQVIQHRTQQNGKLFHIYIGPIRYVVISDPEDVQVIMGNSKFVTRDKNSTGVLRGLIGQGLLTNTGEVWKRHRKIINNAFHIKVLESFMGNFNKNSEVLVQKLKKHTDNILFLVYDYIFLCSVDMLCESMMGTEVNAQITENNIFVNAMKVGNALFTERFVRPWLWNDWIFYKTSLGRKQTEIKKILNNEVEQSFNYRLQMNSRKNYKNEDISEEAYIGEKKKLAFLDLMLDTYETKEDMLSRDELMNEMKSIISAGTDTSAISMAFTIVLLSLYPQYQEQVAKELKDVFGDDMKRTVTVADLSQMNCLERVIKESLRLFPPLPLTTRKINEDVDLRSCTIPAGCNIMVNIYELHRSVDNFADPFEFNPDRFLPEESVRRHPYCYMPFSAGARNCIGHKYAMMQMKTMLAIILRNYEMLPACKREDLEDLDLGLLVAPANGFKVKMQPRMYNNSSN